MKSFKDVIKNYSFADIIFTKHAKIRLEERKLSEDLIKKKLFDLNSLITEEFDQENDKWKIVYDYSKKFKLVIIVAEKDGKLFVITAYKTSKKIEKIIKEKNKKIFIKRVFNSK